MKHIIICGNYGASNLGDEAILEAVLGFLRTSAPGCQITVMSANPVQTQKLHADAQKLDKSCDRRTLGKFFLGFPGSVSFIPCGFRSFFKGIFSGAFHKTLQAIKNTDIFILGGGGLFTDEKPLAVLIWWVQTLPALFFKKTLFCLGQSVGPLRFKWSRFLVKTIFRRAKIITVRDKTSKNLLEELGVKNVVALTDPVFALPGAAFEQKKVIFELKNSADALNNRAFLPTNTAFPVHLRSASEKSAPKPAIGGKIGSKYVVLSLRPWNKLLEAKNVKILARFVELLHRKYGLKTLFIPFQSAPDNDLKVFMAVSAHLENKSFLIALPHKENFKEIMPYLANAQAVIGMRLHSLIFAALVNTPFLALSYSQKVNLIVKELGMAHYLLEWNKLNFSNLEEKFIHLQKNRNQIKRILKEKLLLQRKKALLHIRLLRSGKLINML